MLVSTEGIVLRQIPFSDTSLVVKIFTRDFGLISFIIKGAKSKKYSKANLYNPINLINLSFVKKEMPGLRQIRDANLIFAPDGLHFGIYKSAIAMFIVELLNHTIPEDSHHPEPEKYNFVKESIDFLRNNSLNSHFFLSFMYQYSSLLGIDIPLAAPSLEFGLVNYTNLSQLSLTKKERTNLFIEFEKHFFENLTNYKALKSIDILNEILV